MRLIVVAPVMGPITWDATMTSKVPLESWRKALDHPIVSDR
jgi:hypothetical protein